MRMSGNTSSSSQAQKADVMPTKIVWQEFDSQQNTCGEAMLNDSETAAQASVDFHALRRQVHHLRLRKVVPEWSCPAELWRQFAAPSLCAKSAAQRCGFPRDVCNLVLATSCGALTIHPNMAVHPQSGTAALPRRSANTMVRMAPKASGSSIPSTLLAGLSTAIRGKLVGVPPTEIMQQAMLPIGADWSPYCSKAVSADPCDRPECHTRPRSMMLLTLSTPLAMTAWAGHSHPGRLPCVQH